MKKKHIIHSAALLLGLCLAGCKESLPDNFGAIEGIYFYNQLTDRTVVDSAAYTFIYEDADVLEVPRPAATGGTRRGAAPGGRCPGHFAGRRGGNGLHARRRSRASSRQRLVRLRGHPQTHRHSEGEDQKPAARTAGERELHHSVHQPGSVGRRHGVGGDLQNQLLGPVHGAARQVGAVCLWGLSRSRNSNLSAT